VVVGWTPSREGNTHLKTALAKELISRAERYLNDGGEFCHLLCGVVLNVGNTLEKSG